MIFVEFVKCTEVGKDCISPRLEVLSMWMCIRSCRPLSDKRGNAYPSRDGGLYFRGSSLLVSNSREQGTATQVPMALERFTLKFLNSLPGEGD